MSYSKTRIARLCEKLKAENLDGLYVRNLSNLYWLSAFDGVFDGEPAHALLAAARAQEVFLHTDFRYIHALEEAALSSDIQLSAVEKTHAEWLAALLEEGVLSKAGAGESAVRGMVLGIEDELSLAEYRKLEAVLKGQTIKETSKFVLELRAVKDADEVRRLKAAQAITDAAFAHIVSFIKAGMSEREVKIELEDFMLRQGAEGLAFSSIVATGANGASPHAIAGQTKLEAGQALVLDFGAQVSGYCSDMTRTVFIGEPSARILDAYVAVRQANEEVEAQLKPGVSGAEMQKLAEDILAAAGFEGAMGHSLGHGVGIDVHEEPLLAKKNTVPLEEGNVVTVEPGVYFKDEFGIRLEDFGIITRDGFEVFTQSSHDMVII